jgi:curli biogenesis system outer membrane secretion channel CsgG
MLGGCVAPTTETEATVTSGSGASIQQAQAEAYNGPKARVAVSRFEDKTGKGWYTGKIGDGMADQLSTALFNTNRYILLERQQLGDVLQEQDLGASGRVRQDTAAPIGQIEGAELLITGAVTEFEDKASGGGGGVGGFGGGVVGAVLGGFSNAHMAIDLRVIDTRTSRIVAATSVEGKASDFDAGGALGGYFGGGAVGGALGGWKNTPREKALRVCIQKAVNFIVGKTPVQYYHYGTGSNLATPTSAAPAGATVEVTGSTVNVRSGPGTGNPVLGTVRRGDRLPILGESGSWYQIRLPDGREGWIYNKLVR